MSRTSSLVARAWILVPLGACLLVFWVSSVRRARVEHVTTLVQDIAKVDAQSPTGFAGGIRELIVRAHNNDSYHWIAQTQQMLAQGDWRVRHVDYDNAPVGRAVETPSVYRWWLGLVAWGDHVLSGRPLGASVERAALFADPLLHVLLIIGATIFAAWQFGAWPAALLAAGLATLFPFAAGFLPGAPDDRGLAQVAVIWSVLPLLAGLCGGRDPGSAQRLRRWVLVAGVMGGVSMWISAASQVPILVGTAIGAVLASVVLRRKGGDMPLFALDAAPWRWWALGGAATIVAAYVIEYAPANLWSWRLREVHPIYALGWLGLGEVLTQANAWIRRGKAAWTLRTSVVFVLAVAALAAVPVVMAVTKSRGFLAMNLSGSRLTFLAGGVEASNLWQWMRSNDGSAKLGATLLPIVMVLPVAWLIFRGRMAGAWRAALAVALGPVLVALGFAFWRLSWWNQLDGVLLVLLLAATAALRRPGKFEFAQGAWTTAMVFMFVLGLGRLLPREAEKTSALNESEFMGLIERDLAHWLAKRTGGTGAVVLTTPKLTTLLCYYGGLRGLGTLAWENEAGISGAVRIVSASTPEEAQELINRREVQYIIMPSWDPYLDFYARMGMGQVAGTFLERMQQWAVPSWLRAVPYQLPAIPGFRGESVTIFQIDEEQDEVEALSRTAEFFLETGQLDRAAAVGQGLRRYPASMGAWVARAQVETAVGDEEGLARSLKILLPRLKGRSGLNVPWDRRIGLAVVLARAKEKDLAQEQVRLCLEAMDEEDLRLLPTGSLYRLQVLMKSYGMPFPSEALHALALDLLPVEFRSRL